MKKTDKFIVVVEFEDGAKQEYIVFGEENANLGMSYKGGKIVAVRKLTVKYNDTI